MGWCGLGWIGINLDELEWFGMDWGGLGLIGVDLDGLG